LENLFKGTSQYYANYRPAIPQQVVDYIAELFRLNGEGILLDMGCGTGQSSIPLAPLFKKTIAFDIDAEMLSEAKKKTPMNLNIEWQQRSDKDIFENEGPYKVVMACRSFHWMDQDILLQCLHGILEEGGGVVLVGDGSLWNGQEFWQKQVKEVIQDFLGQDRHAGQFKFTSSKESYVDLLLKKNFVDVKYKVIPVEREWNIQSILGYLYSTSFSSKHLYMDRLSEFESAVKKRLINIEKFTESAEFIIQSGIHRN
jgi:trans-aconitate methyltransferase